MSVFAAILSRREAEPRESRRPNLGVKALSCCATLRLHPRHPVRTEQLQMQTYCWISLMVRRLIIKLIRGTSQRFGVSSVTSASFKRFDSFDKDCIHECFRHKMLVPSHVHASPIWPFLHLVALRNYGDANAGCMLRGVWRGPVPAVWATRPLFVQHFRLGKLVPYAATSKTCAFWQTAVL